MGIPDDVIAKNDVANVSPGLRADFECTPIALDDTADHGDVLTGRIPSAFEANGVIPGIQITSGDNDTA